MEWPDGKLLRARRTLPLCSNQVSLKGPPGGMPEGRKRRVAPLRTVARISASATASPANNAVCCAFRSLRKKPATYNAVGASTMAIEVFPLLSALLNPANVDVRRKNGVSCASKAISVAVAPTTAAVGIQSWLCVTRNGKSQTRFWSCTMLGINCFHETARSGGGGVTCPTTVCTMTRARTKQREPM